MPRKARQKSNTKVYHIILRGNAKQDIFFDKQDYQKMMKEIYHTKEKYEYEVYAYCFMTNHIHLIIYDKNNQLSKILQSLTISYSSYWNKKYDRVGHLFQNRFLSKKVETQGYLKNVCRYIHQNPYKGGIATMEEYQWSSYQEYINGSKIINEKQMLELFKDLKQETIENFIAFHKGNIAQDSIQDFMEYEMVEKLNDEQARKCVIEILGLENVQQISTYNVEKRNEYVKKIKNIRGISDAQIARITGLSRRMVQIVKKENKK